MPEQTFECHVPEEQKSPAQVTQSFHMVGEGRHQNKAPWILEDCAVASPRKEHTQTSALVEETLLGVI